jgi:hypothetical protein
MVCCQDFHLRPPGSIANHLRSPFHLQPLFDPSPPREYTPLLQDGCYSDKTRQHWRNHATRDNRLKADGRDQESGKCQIDRICLHDNEEENTLSSLLSLTAEIFSKIVKESLSLRSISFGKFSSRRSNLLSLHVHGPDNLVTS